jgi:hypothetical protein
MVVSIEIIGGSEICHATFQVCFVSEDLIIQPPTDVYLNLERFLLKYIIFHIPFRSIILNY